MLFEFDFTSRFKFLFLNITNRFVFLNAQHFYYFWRCTILMLFFCYLQYLGGPGNSALMKIRTIHTTGTLKRTRYRGPYPKKWWCNMNTKQNQTRKLHWNRKSLSRSHPSRRKWKLKLTSSSHKLKLCWFPEHLWNVSVCFFVKCCTCAVA